MQRDAVIETLRGGVGYDGPAGVLDIPGSTLLEVTRVNAVGPLLILREVLPLLEAATEDRALKGKIFAQLEALCAPGTIFASNSSHLEPEAIFEPLEDKGRTAVVHYFFPAERNRGLEVGDVLVDRTRGKRRVAQTSGDVLPARLASSHLARTFESWS